jgi:hypothetical protein
VARIDANLAVSVLRRLRVTPAQARHFQDRRAVAIVFEAIVLRGLIVAMVQAPEPRARNNATLSC